MMRLNQLQEIPSKALEILNKRLQGVEEAKLDSEEKPLFNKLKTLRSNLIELEGIESTASPEAILKFLSVMAEATTLLKERKEVERLELEQFDRMMDIAKSSFGEDIVKSSTNPVRILLLNSLADKIDIIAQGPHPDLIPSILEQGKWTLQQLAEDESLAALNFKAKLETGLANIYALFDSEQAYRYRKKAYRHCEEGQQDPQMRENLKATKEMALRYYEGYLEQLKSRRDFCMSRVEGRARAGEFNEKMLQLLSSDRIISDLSAEEEKLSHDCISFQEGTQSLVPDEIDRDFSSSELYSKLEKDVLDLKASFFTFDTWSKFTLLTSMKVISNLDASKAEVEKAQAKLKLNLAQVDIFLKNRYENGLLSAEEFRSCKREELRLQDCQAMIDIVLQVHAKKEADLMTASLASLNLQVNEGQSRSIFQPVPMGQGSNVVNSASEGDIKEFKAPSLS